MNGSEDPIRVVVLAPTQALRMGIRALLSPDDGLIVIGDSSSLSGLDPFSPAIDVIISAQPYPSMRVEFEEILGDSRPYPAVLFLLDDASAVQAMLDLPFLAVGALSEDASPLEIHSAVRALHEGLMVGTPGLITSLLNRQPKRSLSLRDDDLPLDPLTPRELEVLQLLARGLPNKQIAQTLKISEHTVKFHISSIYGKLGVVNRTEAVRAGARLGMIVF